MTGKYDVIILLTKKLHNAEGVTFLRNYLTESGGVVMLQNTHQRPHCGNHPQRADGRTEAYNGEQQAV